MDAAETLFEKIFSCLTEVEKYAENLINLANHLEETQRNVNVSKIIGSSLSVGGAAAMTAAGVATIITGGAALPVIAMAGGAASWAGLAANAASDVVDFAILKKKLKKAEKVVEKEMKELRELAGEEQDGSSSYVIECILRVLGRQIGLDLDDKVILMRIIYFVFKDRMNMENHFHHTLKMMGLKLKFQPAKVVVTAAANAAGIAAAKAAGTATAKAAGTATVKAAGTATAKAAGTATAKAAGRAAAKAAGKAVGHMAGGVFGLVFSVPELIDNCKNLDIRETEASRILRENSQNLRTESEEMKKELEKIKNYIQRVAKVKYSIESRERSRTSKKELMDILMEQCDDDVVQKWLRENSESGAFFKLVDMFHFLKEKIKEEEKKNHSNTVDIIFVAHGEITESMIPACCLLPLLSITDVILYSPWNCVIDGKVAYGVAKGLIEPQHRVFLCENQKLCEIPNAGHQPSKLPSEWNSMKEAGRKNIPNIMLSPLQPPKDAAWNSYEILENKHGKPGRNRIVIPFILPGKNEEVPFFVVSFALSLVLNFSRFEATLHLTACLGKESTEIKLDDDALNEQYACTINNTRMTSKEQMTPNTLFKAFQDVFG